jgi:hypothetical protein
MKARPHATALSLNPIEPREPMPGPGSTSQNRVALAPVAYRAGNVLADSTPGAVTLARLQALHRQRQMAIGMAVSRSVAAVWDSRIRPIAMVDSWGSIRDIITSLISKFYQASASDSARFYGLMRAISGLPYVQASIPKLPPQELLKVVDSQALGTFFHQIKTVDEHMAVQASGRAIEAASSRLALKGGRQAIVDAVHVDPMAVGWERIVSPGSCAFCAMLASRGAVYKTQHNADFQAHDHCHCTAQPIFEGQASSESNRQLSSEWQRVTQGKSGKQAIQEWNSYWEGRNNEQPDHGTAAAPQEDRSGDAAQQ